MLYAVFRQGKLCETSFLFALVNWVGIRVLLPFKSVFLCEVTRAFFFIGFVGWCVVWCRVVLRSRGPAQGMR